MSRMLQLEASIATKTRNRIGRDHVKSKSRQSTPIWTTEISIGMLTKILQKLHVEDSSSAKQVCMCAAIYRESMSEVNGNLSHGPPMQDRLISSKVRICAFMRQTHTSQPRRSLSTCLHIHRRALAAAKIP